jgi:hypothetical protein
MDYTEDFLNKIITMGAYGYPLSKIINVLEIKPCDVDEFAKDFYDTSSEIATKYRIGIDRSDFSIDMQLYTLAQGGDLKAIELFKERKKKNMEIAAKEFRERKNDE